MNKDFIEYSAVKTLLDNYFAAVYKSDISALKTIFHEKAAMYGYLGDIVLAGTPEPFLADLASKPSMAENKDNCNYVIKEINITSKIASATIFVDGFFGSATIEDKFHLIKENNQWKIVCKTFTTL